MKNNEWLEYPKPIKLVDDAAYYFVIPAEIILEQTINKKLVAVFSYFSIKRGLDRFVQFSVNDMVAWIGKKPNRNVSGINNKVKICIEWLSERNYLSQNQMKDNSSISKVFLNLNKVRQECDTNRFATIYVDELQKIMTYKNNGKNSDFPCNELVLLVFAFLRMQIYRRSNKLLPEEINIDNKGNCEFDIQQRRKKCPEAYDAYYYQIAKELDLPVDNVSKAVANLGEIGLICSEELPRFKNGDKWCTDHTIFCNAYKREGSLLLDTGTDYICREISNKKAKLNRYRKSK